MAQRVHRLPETWMGVDHELVLLGEPLERVCFEARAVPVASARGRGTPPASNGAFRQDTPEGHLDLNHCFGKGVLDPRRFVVG